MTLSAPRNTEMMFTSESDILSFPVAASTTIQQGALVVVESNGTDGYAEPGKAATNLIAVGRAEESAVNSGAVGAASVKVRTGVFKFANSSAGDLISSKHLLTNCYVVDDATVAATNGSSTRSVAGKVVQVDSDGVWVAFKPF